MSLTVKDLWKSFDEHAVLKGVSLEVPDGALVALLGPSGCGKTTLLRILAGLEAADAGEVLQEGREVSGRSARERNVGLVFQHYALFRHMTVAENVGFALAVRKAARAEAKLRVDELLALIQLTSLRDRYPHQLSGGQRQRVALARALATSPRVLLLDEPFGALDARVRQELRRWLRDLHDRLHVTSVLVTHDQEEAFEVADQVVLMNAGRVEQVGTPAEVFDEPASPFVLRFLGAVNVFHGRLEGGRALLGAAAHGAPPSRLYVRPHELDLHRSPVPGSIPARVARVVPRGAAARVELTADGHPGTVEVDLDLRQGSAALGLAPGDGVHLAPRRARVFPGADDSLSASGL